MNLVVVEMPDGRVADVFPLTMGRARIGVGDGCTFYDDVW